MPRPRANSRFLKSTGKLADRAATGLFRWVVTDHTGIAQRLANMPAMGFLETLRYLFFQLVITLVAALITGGLVFLGIAYGIPYLLFGHP